MNSLLGSLSARDLRHAAEIKEKIDSLQCELAQILGIESVAANGRGVGGRRKMSATTRARIGEARARKAKIKGTNGTQPRKKRSAAVRARLSAIAKERWRKVKAEGKARL